jgi:putative ubiquitin-RnfH superfamily antitoxin RatB of RatAB toxin-antitoxin module
MIRVEVAYGLMDEQALLELQVELGTTAEEAIERSGILDRFPDIDLKKNKIGIFGKAAKLNVALQEGDRVEIYRPLIADPKEQRKKRAAEGKKMGRGGGNVKK